MYNFGGEITEGQLCPNIFNLNQIFMKKLLLLAAGALLTGASASAQWALVGAYTDPSWNFEASAKFVGEGDVLTCEIPNLIGDFKIVDITNNSWDIQYGTSTLIEIGKTYELVGKKDGKDPANIKFDGLLLSVKDAVVTWNPTTFEFSIASGEPVLGYPTLYVTGNFNNLNWPAPGDTGTVLMTRNDDIYTATFELGTSGNVEFKLAGTGWSNEIAGGATVDDESAVTVTRGGDNLKTTLTGEQTLTFNIATMSMTFGDPSLTEAPVESKTVWSLVGAFNDWQPGTAVDFEGEGDELSCTIDNLISGFKVIANRGWDNALGYNDPIEPNKTYTIYTVAVGGNISFAEPVQSVANAVVKFNPSDYSLTVVAEEANIISGNPTLYLTGSFAGEEWPAPGTEGSIQGVEEEGVYTFSVDLGESGSVSFKVATAGWGVEYAAAEDGVVVGYEAVSVVKGGGEDLTTELTGEQTLIFDLNNLKMWFAENDGDDDDNDNPSAVSSIESSLDAPVYYNLQGVKVNNPQGGIYIIKKGDKTYKTVIK